MAMAFSVPSLKKPCQAKVPITKSIATKITSTNTEYRSVFTSEHVPGDCQLVGRRANILVGVMQYQVFQVGEFAFDP